MQVAVPENALDLGAAVAGLALAWGAGLAFRWLMTHPWVSLSLMFAAALLFLMRLAAHRLPSQAVH